jgi:hypothetical protein
VITGLCVFWLRWVLSSSPGARDLHIWQLMEDKKAQAANFLLLQKRRFAPQNSALAPRRSIWKVAREVRFGTPGEIIYRFAPLQSQSTQSISRDSPGQRRSSVQK